LPDKTVRPLRRSRGRATQISSEKRPAGNAQVRAFNDVSAAAVLLPALAPSA
jgi:hypothetical protein